MSTNLYWVDGPWPGRLAISARPRGGDWLGEDLASWRCEGINVVVSLLMPEEERELDLDKEGGSAAKQCLDFISFPIPDRQVPASRVELSATLDKINANLTSGKKVLVHCRQGIGRSGLVAACLLVTRGWNPSAAVDHLSALRGVAIPETPEQRRWIDQFAAVMAGAK
jgi:protein-tyrosine phosphatase